MDESWGGHVPVHCQQGKSLVKFREWKNIQAYRQAMPRNVDWKPGAKSCATLRLNQIEYIALKFPTLGIIEHFFLQISLFEILILSGAKHHQISIPVQTEPTPTPKPPSPRLCPRLRHQSPHNYTTTTTHNYAQATSLCDDIFLLGIHIEILAFMNVLLHLCSCARLFV